MLHTPVAIYTRRHAASRKCSRHWTRHSRRSNIKSDSIATMQIYEQAPCFTGGACLNNLASRLRDKCVSNDRKACGHYVVYLGQAASPVRFTRRKHRGHADDEKKSPIDRHLQQLPKTTTPPQRDLPKVIVSPPQKIHSKPNACCLVAPLFPISWKNNYIHSTGSGFDMVSTLPVTWGEGGSQEYHGTSRRFPPPLTVVVLFTSIFSHTLQDDLCVDSEMVTFSQLLPTD